MNPGIEPGPLHYERMNDLQARCFVTLVGFEPTISCLKNSRPKPLDDRAIGLPGTTRTCNLLVRSQVFYPLNYGEINDNEKCETIMPFGSSALPTELPSEIVVPFRVQPERLDVFVPIEICSCFLSVAICTSNITFTDFVC